MGKRGHKDKSEVVGMGGKSRTPKGLVLGRSRNIFSFVTGEGKAEGVDRFEGRR